MLIAMMAALAADVPTPPDLCGAEMSARWPAIVAATEQQLREPVEIFDEPLSAAAKTVLSSQEKQGKAVIAAGLSSVKAVRAACSGRRPVLDYLNSAEALLRFHNGDARGAWQVLAAPEDGKLVSLADHDLMRGLEMAGQLDEATFNAAVAKVRARQQAALRAFGLTMLPPITNAEASIDVYRTSDRWLFIGWPKAPLYPAVLTVAPMDGKLIGQLTGCSVSTAVEVSARSDEAMLKFAGEALSASKDESNVMAGLWGGREFRCTSGDSVFVGLDNYRLTGGEFLPDGATPPEAVLQRMLVGSPEQQLKAVDLLIAHPDAIEPMSLINIPLALLARGDRLRAAFWFYFWQARSGPWASFGAPDGDAALRASFNSSIGSLINQWIGSDPAAFVDTFERAWRYEQHVPLYQGRPQGVTAAKWQAAVARYRQQNDPAQLRKRVLAKAAETAEQRAKNGLPNGPLQDSGMPLPDAWR